MKCFVCKNEIENQSDQLDYDCEQGCATHVECVKDSCPHNVMVVPLRVQTAEHTHVQITEHTPLVESHCLQCGDVISSGSKRTCAGTIQGNPTGLQNGKTPCHATYCTSCEPKHLRVRPFRCKVPLCSLSAMRPESHDALSSLLKITVSRFLAAQDVGVMTAIAMNTRRALASSATQQGVFAVAMGTSDRCHGLLSAAAANPNFQRYLLQEVMTITASTVMTVNQIDTTEDFGRHSTDVVNVVKQLVRDMAANPTPQNYRKLHAYWKWFQQRVPNAVASEVGLSINAVLGNLDGLLADSALNTRLEAVFAEQMDATTFQSTSAHSSVIKARGWCCSVLRVLLPIIIIVTLIVLLFVPLWPHSDVSETAVTTPRPITPWPKPGPGPTNAPNSTHTSHEYGFQEIINVVGSTAGGVSANVGIVLSAVIVAFLIFYCS